MGAHHLADLLTRLRNGQRRSSKSTKVLATEDNRRFLGLLLREGYIRRWVDGGEHLTVYLTMEVYRYTLVSRPGNPLHVSLRTLWASTNSLGTGVLSTDRGLMTAQEAMRAGVGGVYLCHRL
jgi:ribosomal protein S8